MTSHMYHLPAREVEHKGEIHMHSTIGSVEDDLAEAKGYRRVGIFDPAAPVECEKCIANHKVWLADLHAELVIKYDLTDNFFGSN